MNYIKTIAISAMMLLGTQVSIGQNQESKGQDKVKVETSNIKQKPSTVSTITATDPNKTKSSKMISEDQEMNGIRERLKTAKSTSEPE